MILWSIVTYGIINGSIKGTTSHTTMIILFCIVYRFCIIIILKNKKINNIVESINVQHYFSSSSAEGQRAKFPIHVGKQKINNVKSINNELS